MAKNLHENGESQTERTEAAQTDSVSNGESHTAVKNSAAQPTVIKKSGTGLSLLAILIALGMGAAGYYLGQQEIDKTQQKLTALEHQLGTVSAGSAAPAVDNGQIAALAAQLHAAEQKSAQLEQVIVNQNHGLTALQTQVQQISQQSQAQQPTEWLFSEADFLLNNALRKLMLDNDVDTAVSLLELAGETLDKIGSPQSATIRAAVNQDLKQLGSVNNIDQNAVMQRLSQLANSIDELAVLNVNFNDAADDKLSDSLSDWKENAEKSATSFLNRFIRITPKDKAANKELLAPNQDIYLRENIRLRLQLAIMAVPRQQNDLYAQSLEAVAAWVRSYFDTNADVTQQFLKSIDELSEISVYAELPDQLQSLNALNRLLNRRPQDVQKVEIHADKAIADMPTADSVAATENPADTAAEMPTDQPAQAAVTENTAQGGETTAAPQTGTQTETPTVVPPQPESAPQADAQ